MTRTPQLLLAALLLGSAPLPLAAQAASPAGPGDWANTFSIVAYDPDAREWGVAVASKYLAVGAAVPFARAGVGAVATQSAVNVSYGPRGLELLEKGMSPEEVLRTLTEEDRGKESRQVGVIDAKGNAANFTGKGCIAWAGGRSGKNYSCQGNLLAGEKVVEAMAEAFENSKGPLAWRLMAAMEAGEKAGGDKRGKQSAAILIVRDRGGPGGLSDRYLDLRVDDHKEPLEELARILSLRVRRPKPVD
jgi:uncharacterized Ntn-hydrolase superfamily protein